jgi:hypothetical protein
MSLIEATSESLGIVWEDLQFATATTGVTIGWLRKRFGFLCRFLCITDITDIMDVAVNWVLSLLKLGWHS